jgi:trk system potassium uptake protein TrkH
MSYSPTRTLVLFFLGLIALGTVLLSLPIARNSSGCSFIVNLFTSVSAVCVTGLSVVNICEYYSAFGQITTLLLVQLGGVGYMFVSTAIALLLGSLTLKDKRIMQDMFDISSFNGLKELLSKAFFFVLTAEFVGAVVLTFIFLGDFSFLKSAYLGVFYSIMAFCNAGFSFFNESLVRFTDNPSLLCVMSFLIIFGRLGFFIIVDVYEKCRKKRLHFSTHTKIVVSISASITVFAFVLFLFSDALQGCGVLYLISNAFFQAVSLRTAGFYSVSIDLFDRFTEIVLLFLMLVGSSPGGTAGGIKITTLALVFVFIKSMLNGDDFILFKRRISVDLVKKALAIFIVFFASVAFFSAVLVLLENSLKPLALVFEVVSAFATAGLSLGITADLSIAGKILIITAMILGRIGILTILVIMLGSSDKNKNVKYPEDRILVG